jgi:hypothetical protein
VGPWTAQKLWPPGFQWIGPLAGRGPSDLISLQRGMAGSSSFSDNDVKSRNDGLGFVSDTTAMASQAAPAKRQQGWTRMSTLWDQRLTFSQTSKCNTALTKTHCSRSRRRLATSSKKPRSTSQNPPSFELCQETGSVQILLAFLVSSLRYIP